MKVHFKICCFCENKWKREDLYSNIIRNHRFSFIKVWVQCLTSHRSGSEWSNFDATFSLLWENFLFELLNIPTCPHASGDNLRIDLWKQEKSKKRRKKNCKNYPSEAKATRINRRENTKRYELQTAKSEKDVEQLQDSSFLGVGPKVEKTTKKVEEN